MKGRWSYLVACGVGWVGEDCAWACCLQTSDGAGLKEIVAYYSCSVKIWQRKNSFRARIVSHYLITRGS